LGRGYFCRVPAIPIADNLPLFIYNTRAFTNNPSVSPGGSTMMLIRHVIKDREPYSMNASATVQDAAEFMASRNIGAVCVVDDAGKLLGVFSERDVLRRVVVLRRDPLSVKVGDVTSELRAVINCDETPHQALERMDSIGTRHLPVVDGERWVGMLSMRDLMRVELGEQGDEIKLLHEYIQH
jgi:CBS domain-containing protein